MSLQGDHRAAWRRRQRRLRSWWRHEQQTVAAVLATVTHHSHSKVGTANGRPKRPEASHQHQGGTCRVYELSSDDGRPTREERPAALLELRPQGAGAATRRHRVRAGPSSRCSCAADGRTVGRVSFSSSPRICRWLPSRLSTCPRSHKTGLRSAWGTVCVNRRWRTSWWMCRLSCLPVPGRAGGVCVEVFKALAQDRVQQLLFVSLWCCR